MILTLITIVRLFFGGDCHGVQGVLYLKHQLEVQKIGTPIFPWIFEGLWLHPWVKPWVTLDHPLRETEARWWGQFQNKVMMFFFPNQCRGYRIRIGKDLLYEFSISCHHLRPRWISSVFASQLTTWNPTPPSNWVAPDGRFFLAKGSPKKGNSTPPVFTKGDGIHLHLESLRCHFSKGQAVSLCPRSWFDPDLYGSESEAEVVEDGCALLFPQPYYSKRSFFCWKSEENLER